MYCSNCINSIEYPPIHQLERQNAELNISTDQTFICAHCKTNVILCNVKSNTQTKKLNITRLQEYDKCLQILKFLLLDV